MSSGLSDLGNIAWQLGQSLGISFGLYGLYRLSIFVYKEVTSPLRDLPGPPSKSFIYGNFKEIWDADDSSLTEKWVEDYGSTIRFKGILGITRLYTTDLKAINHILANNYDYQKPAAAIYNIKRILGEGVLLVEGDVHHDQRRILNPAFGPQQIRELTEIFVEKAVELRDIWTAEILTQDKEDVGRIDALSWLSRLTLDVIGLAGFNYKFKALESDPETNELSKAFAVMFKTGTRLGLVPILRGLFPLLRFLPAERDAESKKASETMFSIGAELLEKSKQSSAKETDKKSARPARDVLSLLVRANTMPDLPENQRMSDKDVLAQIPTFLVAGHETTSVATTWALFALTQNKSVQTKLREELSKVSTDNPSMDDLNSLPYLDAVVHETLRVYAPVPDTLRVAMKDDYLPLSQPFMDRKGVLRSEIQVTKGQTISVPIVTINKSKALWGADAGVFKPERWEKTPEAVGSVPGIWGNMMTFLGGPRACIGYRFTLVEMKSILFTLVRAFEFDLAVPASDIVKKSGVVQRPVLVTDKGNTNQLPLLVKLVPQH